MIPTHLCEIQGDTAIFGTLNPIGDGWRCINCGKVFVSLEDAKANGLRTAGALGAHCFDIV